MELAITEIIFNAFTSWFPYSALKQHINPPFSITMDNFNVERKSK